MQISKGRPKVIKFRKLHQDSWFFAKDEEEMWKKVGTAKAVEVETRRMPWYARLWREIERWL